MLTSRHCRQITAWLAAIALVLGSLLPALSHAVVSAPVAGQGWVQVCTVSGMAWVQQLPAATADSAMANDGATDSPAAPAGMGQCSWCATHGHLAGLPTVAQPLVLPQVFVASVPAAFLQAPRPLFVWAAAQSRAPPALV